MKAMILKKIAPVEEKPLELEDLPIPQPGPKQIRVKISACGVCHTELDEIEGRLQPRLPIILGHEIVGKVESLDSEVTKFKSGERVVAKIMVPESEESLTKGIVKVDIPKQDANILDAACRGASEGAKLAINIAAVLICFIAFVALLNWVLSVLPNVAGAPLTLERILGWFCAPLAWVMGVEWNDAGTVGMLLGKKTIMNEFVAYVDLVKYKDVISQRSFTIATYALCGFANFGSIAIQIGGYGSLVPTRRKDFAKMGLRAMIGGSLAAFMTATIAGILI